jgi:hypothetical protein
MTSYPAAAKWRTASDPISPLEPVIIAVFISPTGYTAAVEAGRKPARQFST